jgi:hypothetical protein
MEHNKIETEVVQEVVSEAIDAKLRELSDLQLAFVGGGICDTIPH